MERGSGPLIELLEGQILLVIVNLPVLVLEAKVSEMLRCLEGSFVVGDAVEAVDQNIVEVSGGEQSVTKKSVVPGILPDTTTHVLEIVNLKLLEAQ